MPADRIDAAVRRLVPDPVICWCNGQSLESRYASSAPPHAGGAGPNLAGGAILRHELGKARRPDASPMPRFPVVAVATDRIYLFDGPVPDEEAFACLERDHIGVLHGGGAMWRRIDLVMVDGEPRSYTMMVNGLFGGRKRFTQLVAELERGRRG